MLPFRVLDEAVAAVHDALFLPRRLGVDLGSTCAALCTRAVNSLTNGVISGLNNDRRRHGGGQARGLNAVEPIQYSGISHDHQQRQHQRNGAAVPQRDRRD